MTSNFQQQQLQGGAVVAPANLRFEESQQNSGMFYDPQQQHAAQSGFRQFGQQPFVLAPPPGVGSQQQAQQQGLPHQQMHPMHDFHGTPMYQSPHQGGFDQATAMMHHPHPGMFHPNGGMFPPGYYGPYSHMMPVPSPFVAASHQSTEEVSALREQLAELKSQMTSMQKTTAAAAKSALHEQQEREQLRNLARQQLADEMSDGEQQQQQQIVNNLHLDSSASPPSELNSSDQVVTMPTSTTSNSGAGNQIDEAIRFGAIGEKPLTTKQSPTKTTVAAVVDTPNSNGAVKTQVNQKATKHNAQNNEFVTVGESRAFAIRAGKAIKTISKTESTDDLSVSTDSNGDNAGGGAVVANGTHSGELTKKSYLTAAQPSEADLLATQQEIEVVVGNKTQVAPSPLENSNNNNNKKKQQVPEVVKGTSSQTETVEAVAKQSSGGATNGVAKKALQAIRMQPMKPAPTATPPPGVGKNTPYLLFHESDHAKAFATIEPVPGQFSFNVLLTKKIFINPGKRFTVQTQMAVTLMPGLRLLISGPLKDETNDKALFVSSNIRCDAHSPIHILIKNKTDEVIELDAGVCIGQIVFVKEIVCAPTMMSNTVFQTLTHKDTDINASELHVAVSEHLVKNGDQAKFTPKSDAPGTVNYKLFPHFLNNNFADKITQISNKKTQKQNKSSE